MSLWRRRDEQCLRKAFRRRIKHSPGIRKKLRKAPKALYYRPVARTFALCAAIASSCILPVFAVRFASELPADAALLMAVPFALALVSWIGAATLLFRIRNGIEVTLYDLVPLRADVAFTQAFRGGVLSCAYLLALVMVALYGVLMIRSQPGYVLAFYTLHLPAMLVTIPYCLKLRDRLPPYAAPLALLGLFFATLFHARIPVMSKGALLACRTLFPNGWAQSAIDAFGRHEPFLATSWLLLLGLAAIPAAMLIRAERRLFITTLETIERDDESEAIDAGSPVPLALGWEAAGWLERSVQKWVHPDQYPTLELLRGGSFDWSKRWKRGLGFAIAGGIISLLPNPLCQWSGTVLAGIGVLDATPMLGGAWPGLQNPATPHGTAYMLAAFPISLRQAARAVLRVNVMRCVAAFPHWLLLGWVFGKTIQAPIQTLSTLGMIWVTGLVWQPAITLLNMTQRGISCVRGRWWRVPLSVAMLLAWLMLVGATFIMALTTALHMSPFPVWLAIMFSGTVFSTIMAEVSQRQITGRAFDHLYNPPRNLFS